MRVALLALACLSAGGAHALTQPQRAAVIYTYPYDTDAEAYFAKLVSRGCPAPSANFKRRVANYIIAEKGYGNWGAQTFAYIHMFSACIAGTNLAQPALYPITWTGGVTFTAGLSGDGSTGYGDTVVLQSALNRITQNNSRVEACNVGGNGSVLGASAAGTVLAIGPSTNESTKITSLTAVVDTGAGGNGCHSGWRTSSTVVTTLYNGVVLSNAVANTSAALAAVSTTLCRNAAASFCSSGNHIYWSDVGAAIPNEAAHYVNLITMLRGLGAGV